MSGPISSLNEFNKNRKHITIYLRGPKGMSKSIGSTNKPPHLKDFFNSTNSTLRSESIGSNEIKNGKSFFDLILENKNKIYFILTCERILYICFKKFSLVRKFYRKVKKISNHWIFKNRLTRAIFALWKRTS